MSGHLSNIQERMNPDMNRLKLLAAIAVLGLPLAACEETTPPPPVGSIVGTVSIEGTGIDGVSVNLSNGNTTTTAGGGSYRFDNVEGGAYTVTISGFPSDAMFDATSAAATIASAGQSVTLNFTGAYIRTASVMGTVTVENMGLGGVTVALSGVSSASAVTDDNGQYAFTGLRMGNYAVEISGFDNDEIGFSATSSAVTVGTGESKIVSFDGTYLRTAGIQGQVSVEGVGLEGVNVSLAGGPDGEDMSTTTDAAGLYSFAKLRAGDYAVGISGFNTDDYEFAVTSHNVTIALGETANVPFDGILRRTSGVAGRVSVNGMGIADVTVTVSADGMDDVTAMTDATGQYAVSALAAGDYTVMISGYDAVEYMFEDSRDVTLAMDATEIVNFEGTALRTGSISVSVTADDEGVAGAGVTLTMITGLTSGTVLGTQATDADGGATFGPLLAGTYRVDIAVDSDEIDFESTTATMAVATAEAASVSFAGTINRTASISGAVTVDGEGMSGVMVMLTGGEEDMSAETGDDGSYGFSGLRKGDYTVAITNPDEARYEFTSTSESVSLAVGQEQSVSFAGAMVTSSSISGRVGPDDGTGVEGVMVTLSGDADDEATTDAGGLYTFTGLGAGDYTVSIMLSDDQEAAYNFAEGETSKSVTLGDDDQQTVNFNGSHDMSASVTVRLFIDEATNNDMFDEGEHPFPTPEMLAALAAAAQMGLPVMLPISLEGPGVGETHTGAPMLDGSVVFSDLKAGKYQLSVSYISDETLDAIKMAAPMLAAALQDYAFGGDPAGYEIDVGVGEQKMHHAPIDITHTTVNFGVSLRSGEMAGDALPGATVTLYSDAMGEDDIGEGMTALNDATGHAVASIRVAREGTSGNTVYAGVVAPDDYTVSDGMTPVMWDPQKTYTVGGNANDIVNLNVDATFSGATVDRGDYGGGDELAGWAVSVMMGDSAVADASEELDKDGKGAFEMAVDAVPATFSIALDTIQDDKLDGGESFEADPIEYTHDGLSLAGTMDAGMLEVTYTTQTLKVYVHHEKDQVDGYTGNILGGDYRASGIISVDIRHIVENGRSSAFATSVKISKSDSKGVVTFRGVPADANVIAVADEVAQDPEDEDYQPVMLLEPDELAAYTDADGATGGMFGENGGFSHTVELCPLMAVDPTGQDHGECGSFAFVETYAVHGQAWKNDVVMNSTNDGFTTRGLRHVPGTTVDLDPVAGKNLGGDSESFTAASSPTRTRGEDAAGTSILDERKQFDFGRMAAGVYKVTVPTGWVAKVGGPADASGLAATAFNPLAGDTQVDVTPTWGILYGRVTGAAGFPLDSTTVSVNGMSTETDEFGRYIVDGFAHRTGANTAATNPDWRRQRIVVVTASRGGFDVKADTMLFNGTVNNPTEHNIPLDGTAETATVSGTVTAFGSDTPIAGVQIRVDGVAPINKNAKSSRSEPKNDIYITGADGTYEISVPAKGVGMTSRISAHRAGMTFTPAHLDLSTPKGSSISGINFSGVANSTIAGRVQNPDGGPLTGVKVTATAVGATAATDSATTGATGTFSLSVPAGTYDVEASKDGYMFTCPGDPASCRITVGLGQTGSFGDFKSEEVDAPPSDDATLSALSLSDGVLDPAFSSADTMYTADVGVDVDTITVMATANDADADTVAITPADADTVEAGHQVALAIGDDNVITVTVTAEDEETTMTYTVTVDRSDGHQAPSAPTSLTVTPGDQSATVTWRAPRQIGSTAIAGYDWEASAPGQLTRAGTLDPATDAPVAGVFTQAVDGLVNGATYTFSVWAVNTKGDPAVNVRGPAATATAKAQPAITLNLSAATLTEGDTVTANRITATVELSQPSIEAITVSVVEVFAEDDEDMTKQVTITNPNIVIAAGSTTAATTADPTTITAIDDVVDDDDANALVQATATNAIDSDSNTGEEGQQPATIDITDNDDVPAAPTLTVRAGNAQLTLEWISPENTGTSDITHYQYRHSTDTLDDDDAWTTVAGGANARTVVIGNLTNGTAVNVAVRAVSAAGDGAAATSSATPTAPGE